MSSEPDRLVPRRIRVNHVSCVAWRCLRHRQIGVASHHQLLGSKICPVDKPLSASPRQQTRRRPLEANLWCRLLRHHNLFQRLLMPSLRYCIWKWDSILSHGLRCRPLLKPPITLAPGQMPLRFRIAGH